MEKNIRCGARLRALAACDRFAAAEPAPVSIPPLKSTCPAPFGAAVKAYLLDDADWVALARAQVSQLTPEWEMKMEYVLANGLGRPNFDRSDRIAAFAAKQVISQRLRDIDFRSGKCRECGLALFERLDCAIQSRYFGHHLPLFQIHGLIE